MTSSLGGSSFVVAGPVVSAVQVPELSGVIYSSVGPAGPASTVAGPKGDKGDKGDPGPAGASGGAVDVAGGMAGAVVATSFGVTDEVPFLSGSTLKRIAVANLRLSVDGGSP